MNLCVYYLLSTTLYPYSMQVPIELITHILDFVPAYAYLRPRTFLAVTSACRAWSRLRYHSRLARARANFLYARVLRELVECNQATVSGELCVRSLKYSRRYAQGGTVRSVHYDRIGSVLFTTSVWSCICLPMREFCYMSMFDFNHPYHLEISLGVNWVSTAPPGSINVDDPLKCYCGTCLGDDHTVFARDGSVPAPVRGECTLDDIPLQRVINNQALIESRYFTPPPP